MPLVWIAGRIHWMQGQFQMITEDGIVSRDRGWCEFLVPRPWFVRLLVRPAKPANERRRIRQLNPRPLRSDDRPGGLPLTFHNKNVHCTHLDSNRCGGRYRFTLHLVPSCWERRWRLGSGGVERPACVLASGLGLRLRGASQPSLKPAEPNADPPKATATPTSMTTWLPINSSA